MKATFAMKPVSISLMAAVFLSALACRADFVVTVKERVDGVVSLKDGQLVVGENPVAWKDISYLVRENVERTMTSPAMVKLKNGELWACDISGFIGKKLSIN